MMTEPLLPERQVDSICVECLIQTLIAVSSNFGNLLVKRDFNPTQIGLHGRNNNHTLILRLNYNIVTPVDYRSLTVYERNDSVDPRPVTAPGIGVGDAA